MFRERSLTHLRVAWSGDEAKATVGDEPPPKEGQGGASPLSHTNFFRRADERLAKPKASLPVGPFVCRTKSVV
jgi:hypothetical protein